MALRVVWKSLWKASDAIKVGETLLRLVLTSPKLLSLTLTERVKLISFTPKSGWKKEVKTFCSNRKSDISESLKTSSLDHLFPAILQRRKVFVFCFFSDSLISRSAGVSVLQVTGFFKTQLYIWKSKQYYPIGAFHWPPERSITSQGSSNIDFLLIFSFLKKFSDRV